MSAEQNIPHEQQPITEGNGTAHPHMRGWMETVSRLIDNMAVLESNGNPNGQVTADAKRYCFDLVSNTLYFKTQNGNNTGWIPLN